MSIFKLIETKILDANAGYLKQPGSLFSNERLGHGKFNVMKIWQSVLEYLKILLKISIWL